MTCQYCEHLSEENIRKAFRERKSLVLERIDIVEKWHDTVSPEGKPAVAAKFFCDACGRTHDIVVEILGEPDPEDWWKA